jgi:hypothetical protein
MTDTTDNITRVLRIYLRGRKMQVGRPGDGDRGREYRVRFVQHIVAGV